MINNVSLTGRLTRDPELRVSQSNVEICNFTLAVNRNFTDRNGERQADFINCVAFKKQAELIKQYVFKGHLFGVEGRLQSRSYDDKDGKRVFVTEVVVRDIHFLEPKNSNQSNNNQQQNNNYQQSQQQYNQQSNVARGDNPFENSPNINENDLPF